MKSKKKTIFVILDGFDYEYIVEHIEHFVFFKKLLSEDQLCPLESVVPADSIPSWTTIYTGLNPAEHGILESIDYLNTKSGIKMDGAEIRGKTFWDVLSRQGKKVFVFNPFMAYPAWDVNGLMICGPVFEGGDVSTNAPEKIEFDTLPPIGGIVDHPTDKEMEEFCHKTMELSQRQFDAFYHYFERDIYDFAFLGITTPDRMQHFLWRYTDPDDRTYPGDGRLKGSVLNMYLLMEKNVQHIMSKYGDEYNVVVASDHGHGRRCEKTFYVNQWLINQGFIEDKSKKKRAIEYLKNATFKVLADFHIVEAGTKFFKRFKFAHKVKNADYIFSDKKKKIYVPNFDGCNPFGGINVSRELFSSDDEYEQMRQRLIEELHQVEDCGKPIMKWVKRREDIYQGDMVNNYPDIVFLMDSSYGVDRGLFGKRLFGISAMHEVVSGGHRYIGVIMGHRDDTDKVGCVINLHNYMLNITTE